MKREMCRLIKPYQCKECGNELLFFTTDFGAMIDYKDLFYKMTTSKDLYNNLQHRKIKYIKCMTCNKLYLIDWSRGYPIQLTNPEYINKFRV